MVCAECPLIYSYIFDMCNCVAFIADTECIIKLGPHWFREYM